MAKTDSSAFGSCQEAALTTRRLYNRSRSHIASKQTSIPQSEDLSDHSRRDKEGGTGQSPTASSIASEEPSKSLADEPPILDNPAYSGSGKGEKSKKKKDDQGTSKDSLSDGGASSDSVKSKKKDKKEKSEDGSEKKSSVKSTVRKVKKLVSGNGSSTTQHHAPNHFESCNSDDIAPSMQDVNVIVPLVCKQVWNERLTDLAFREDCILIATQDGIVHLWCRPEFYAAESFTGNAGVSIHYTA